LVKKFNIMADSLNSLHQLKSQSLRERILDVLRDAILSGELKPGQSLVETDLAAQLGVSRAPLREAIQTLNNEGLVETIPYHGTSVRILSKIDIEELYSLRSVLEAFAIQRLIMLDKTENLEQLQAIYEEMLAAADADDLKQVSEIDRVFHDALIAMSEHSLLQSTWNSVALRVRQVMALRNMRNADIKQIAYNHLPSIEAIRDCDVLRATALIQEHVASAGDLIVGNWNEDQQRMDSK
ncbi:MAG: GntR family transcriptional regulator, partial [Anaerolineae bacterium]|nr:GntR family transcriptional regulator [Anaerolineae bacterium]